MDVQSPAGSRRPFGGDAREKSLQCDRPRAAFSMAAVLSREGRPGGSLSGLRSSLFHSRPLKSVRMHHITVSLPCQHWHSPLLSLNSLAAGLRCRAKLGRIRESVGLLEMSNSIGRSDDGDNGTGIVTKTKPKTKRPALYRVLLLNDDYTPMEFVVHVLERFFQKGRDEATRIMLHVHQHGVGECGIYTYEVAETKVTQVMDFARKHQHPLQCVMERK